MLQNKKRSNRPSGGSSEKYNFSNNTSSNMRSPRSRPVTAEGVYSNGYFLHAAASHLGENVKVQTKGGVIVEGIFKTFSPNFQIALEVTHSYQNGADGKKINVDTVQDFLIINPCDIVTIHAKDVDLEYVTKDTLLFQTDTAISSRLNGGNARFEDKELEPWDCSENNGEMGVSLELDNNVNGWDVNEMFQKNEKDYGVRTTFNETLVNYTVQIEKKDTQDFREKELQAERIANEIEKNPVYRERVDLENGDEEAAFAAVIRPGSNNRESSSGRDNNNSTSNVINSNTSAVTATVSTTTNNNNNINNSSGGNNNNNSGNIAHNSIPPNINNSNNNNSNNNSSYNNNNVEKLPPTAKYIVPHKRNSKNMPNTKMVRNTPPPQSMAGVPQSPQAPLKSYPLMQQQQQQQGPPQGQQQQSQPPPQQSMPPTQYGGHISHGQSHGHNVYTPPSQMHNPHQSHSGPPQSVANKMNSTDGGAYNNSNNNKAMGPRGTRTYQPSNSHPPPPPVSFNEPPPQIPVQGIPSHQMGKSGMAHPPHPHTTMTHLPPPNVSVPDTQQPPPNAHVHTHHVVLQPVATAVPVPQSSVTNTSNIPPPQPQRPPRIREDQMSRSRDDEVQSLRKFHTDFSLAPPTAGQPANQQQSHSVGSQSISGGQQQQQDNSNQQEKDHPPPPQHHHQVHHSAAQHQQREREQQQQQQQQEKSHVQNQTTPPSSTTSSVNSNLSNSGSSNTSSGNNNINNNQISSIETTPTSSNVAGNSGENKTSTGPKKYVLNPAAKPFTPRSPSTPTQSRPHTPITPSPLAQQSQQAQQQQQQQQQMAQQQTQYTTVTATGQHVPQMMMTYVMPNATTFQAPQQPHAIPRNPTRKMLHVAAATGQPLLTPAPLQQVIHYPAQTPQGHPFQAPTYQPAQVVRMYHEPPHQPSTVQYLAPTPPSTTPSPGQNHQYHPGPQPSPAGGGPSYPQAPQFQMFQPVQILQPTHTPSFPLVYQGGQQGHPQQIQLIMHNQHQNSAQ